MIKRITMALSLVVVLFSACEKEPLTPQKTSITNNTNAFHDFLEERSGGGFLKLNSCNLEGLLEVEQNQFANFFIKLMRANNKINFELMQNNARQATIVDVACEIDGISIKNEGENLSDMTLEAKYDTEYYIYYKVSSFNNVTEILDTEELRFKLVLSTGNTIVKGTSELEIETIGKAHSEQIGYSNGICFNEEMGTNAEAVVIILP